MKKVISGVVVSSVTIGLAAACGSPEGTGASGSGGRVGSGGSASNGSGGVVLASGGAASPNGGSDGGTSNGGASAGGASAGGASAGGASAGGASAGGASAGGASVGGASAGGTSTGGASAGGASAGGTSRGGAGAGGTGTGGSGVGGAGTGGGAAKGGAANGGAANGGAASGGAGSGGKASGGTGAGGAASGGSGNGGSGGLCTITNGGLASSNGQLTCYYFGQGTSTGVCMGSTTYKTNCGYCGSEGSASGNACNPGHNDQVANISTGNYFVAIPSFGQGASCGLCVSISYGGKTAIATVIDNCATCQAGSPHLDLSPALGAALGMGIGTGQTENPKSGVTFKSVACPVTGNIVAVYNGVYTGQLYLQNLAFPLTSAAAVIGSTTHTATLTNGFWDFGITLPVGAPITLKDTQGHTVTGTLGSNGGSLGVQFPLTCQ